MSINSDNILSTYELTNSLSSFSSTDLTPSLQTPPIPYSQLSAESIESQSTYVPKINPKDTQNHTFKELYEKWNNELRSYPLPPKPPLSFSHRRVYNSLPYLPNTNLKRLLNHRNRDFVGWEAHDSRRYNAPSSSYGIQNLLPEYIENDNKENMNEDNRIKNENKMLLSKVKELKNKLKEKENDNSSNDLNVDNKKEEKNIKKVIKPRSSRISKISRIKLNKNSIPKVFVNNSTQMSPTNDFLSSFQYSINNNNNNNNNSDENEDDNENEMNEEMKKSSSFTTPFIFSNSSSSNSSTSCSENDNLIENNDDNNNDDEMSIEMANHIINCEDKMHNHCRLEYIKSIKTLSQMKYHYLYKELIKQKNKRKKNMKQLLELLSTPKNDRNSLFNYNNTLLTQLINQRYKKEVILSFRMNKDRNHLINYLINKYRKKEIKIMFLNWYKYCKNLNIISNLLKSVVFHYKCRVELLYMNKWIEYLYNLTIYTSSTSNTPNTSNTSSTSNTSNTPNTPNTHNTDNTNGSNKHSNNLSFLLNSPEDIYPLTIPPSKIPTQSQSTTIENQSNNNNNILSIKQSSFYTPSYSSSSSSHSSSSSTTSQSSKNNDNNYSNSSKITYPLLSLSTSNKSNSNNNNNIPSSSSPQSIYPLPSLPTLNNNNNEKESEKVNMYKLSRTSSLSSIISALNDPNYKWFNNNSINNQQHHQQQQNMNRISNTYSSYLPSSITPASPSLSSSSSLYSSSIIIPISQSLKSLSIENNNNNNNSEKYLSTPEVGYISINNNNNNNNKSLSSSAYPILIKTTQSQFPKQQLQSQQQNIIEESKKEKDNTSSSSSQSHTPSSNRNPSNISVEETLSPSPTTSSSTTSSSLLLSDSNISSIINDLNNNESDNNSDDILNIRRGINITKENNVIEGNNEEKEEEKEKDIQPISIDNNNISTIIKSQASSSRSSKSSSSNEIINPILERLTTTSTKNNKNKNNNKKKNQFKYKPLDWNEYKKNKNNNSNKTISSSPSSSSPLLSTLSLSSSSSYSPSSISSSTAIPNYKPSSLHPHHSIPLQSHIPSTSPSPPSLALLSDSVDIINSSISTKSSPLSSSSSSSSLLLLSNQTGEYPIIINNNNSNNSKSISSIQYNNNSNNNSYPIPSDNNNNSFSNNNNSDNITYPLLSNISNKTPQFTSSLSLSSPSSSISNNNYLPSPDGSYPIINNSIKNNNNNQIQQQQQPLLSSSSHSHSSSYTSSSSSSSSYTLSSPSQPPSISLSISNSDKSIQTSLKPNEENNNKSNKSIQTSITANPPQINPNISNSRSFKISKKNNKRSASLPAKQLKHSNRKSSSSSSTTSTNSTKTTKSEKSIKPISKPNDDFVVIKPINREEIEKNIQERINNEIKMKNDIDKADKHYKFKLLKNFFSIWYINYLYDKEKVAIAEIKIGDYILMKNRKIKQKFLNCWKKYYIYKKTLKYSSKYYNNVLLQKYTRFWYKYKEEKNEKEKYFEICENAIRMRHNQLLLHNIIIEWYKNTIYNKKNKIVDKYSEKSLMRKCLMNWKDYTDMKYRFHLYYNNLQKQIENRHLYYLKKEIFKIWKNWCMKKIFRQTRIKLFDKKKKKKALLRLYLYCKRKQSLRYLYHVINPTYIKFLKTLILNKWRRYVIGKINSKKLKKRIIRKNLKKIIRLWFNYSLKKQKYRIYYERISNKIKYNHNKILLKSSFIKWCNIYIENKKNKISIQFYENKLLNKSFNRIKNYFIYKIHLKIASEYYNKKIMKENLLYLLEYSQIHKNNREYLKDKEIKIYNLHQYYQLSNSFNIWKYKYNLRKKQIEIANERYLYKLIKKIFLQWRIITIKMIENDINNNEFAIEYYNTHYFHNVVNYWHNYCHLKRINRENDQKCKEFYNLNMKMKCIKNWNEVTMKMKELRLRYYKMNKIIRPFILKKSYIQWNEKYKTHLKLKKVFGYIEKIAVERYQANIKHYSDEFQLLKIIFESWKKRIIKRKVKKILLSKAFKADYSYNNQLILKSFKQWKYNSKLLIRIKIYRNKWNIIKLKKMFGIWRDEYKNTKKLIYDFQSYWNNKYIIEKHFNIWKNNILMNKIYKNSILRNYFKKWKDNSNNYNNKVEQAIKMNNYYITSRYFQLWNENVINSKKLNYENHKAEIYYKLKIIKKCFNVWKRNSYIEIIKRDTIVYKSKKLMELCYTKWKIYYLKKKKQKENYTLADKYALENISRRNCYPLLRSKILSYLKYWKQYACRKRVMKYKFELLDFSTDSLSSCD